jgi:uncharacterized protein YgiB involved in biofilm formation
MLRSRRVSWVSAGGMVALVSVAGCDDKPPPAPPVFGSVEQCMLAGNPKADCDAAAEKVAADHQASAPRYSDPKSCEAMHGAGNCEPRRSSSGVGDVFMPAMAGFMLGQALSGGFGAPQPIYRDPRGYSYLPGQAPWQAPPMNQDNRGSSSSAGGRSGGGFTGVGGGYTRSPGSASAPTAAAPAQTAQRGVLGGTGRASATSVGS